MFGFGKKKLEPAVGPRPIRDTDADWRKIGSDEPFFGVLRNPRFLKENLSEAAKAEFYLSGVREAGRMLEMLRRRFGPFEPRSALDFGSGVGRLTRALAEMTGDAVGVDISDGMLAEARKIAMPGLVFQKELPDRSFDWVMSIIVFQHIPPERGYGILRDLVARLELGGCVSFQFALYRDPSLLRTAGARIDIADGGRTVADDDAFHSLPEGETVMFDYDLTMIAAILFEAGIEEIDLRHTDHGGFHGVYLLGRKKRGQPSV